jgi:pentatricopeptide repeat protein
LASFLRRYDENITLRQSQTDLTLKDIQPGSNAFTHIISARIAAQKETRSREAVLNTMLSLVCRMTGKQLCSDESMIPFSGANTRPNTQTLNAALEVCAMASNMQYSTIADEYTKKVLKLLVPEIPSPLENMHGPFRTQAVRRDATTTRLLIKGSARRGKLVEAFQVAAASPSRTLSDRTYSALLSACLTTGDIDEAVALLERCGIVRLSFDRPIAPSMLSDMLWQVSLQKNNPGTENEIPNSCGTIYLPTLLRLLQALTAKGHENIGGKANRTTELVRLTWAVDILVNQCPGRLNGDSSSKEYCNALDAYIIVAKACLRLGGQPRLLRRVIDAAQKAGFELENRMSLSNGYLRVGEMYNDVVTQGEVLWGSQVAAETVAASVNENLSRLTRAIERKST